MKEIKFDDAIELTNQLIKKHSVKYPQLKGWRVFTNKRKRSFGTCYYNKKSIGLSPYLLPHCTSDAILNTITHEIAHAIVGHGHHHDYLWRQTHIELGGDGERCGDSDNYVDGKAGQKEILQKNAKYVSVCSCGNTYYRYRRPTRESCCSKCCSFFDKDKILVWKRNV